MPAQRPKSVSSRVGLRVFADDVVRIRRVDVARSRAAFNPVSVDQVPAKHSHFLAGALSPASNRLCPLDGIKSTFVAPVFAVDRRKTRRRRHGR
jgi:hypothetical protein